MGSGPLSRGALVVIGGGVRSGKSSYALARARSGGHRRAFVATAQRSDDEMRARIERHVDERGAEFVTHEVALDLPESLAPLIAGPAAQDVVVVDCVTLWLSNLLLAGHDAPAALARVDDLVATLAQRSAVVVVVTNEVGMGVVPASELGRAFRDVAGAANQRLARAADEVYVAAMGLILRLRPDPVAVVAP